MSKIDLEEIRKDLYNIIGPTPEHMEPYMLVSGDYSERIKPNPVRFESEYSVPFGANWLDKQ